MKSSTQTKLKQKTESKEKPEMIVEKMEGGILVRRYKGQKVDVEPEK
jgi:hypothetical protein